MPIVTDYATLLTAAADSPLRTVISPLAAATSIYGSYAFILQ